MEPAGAWNFPLVGLSGQVMAGRKGFEALVAYTQVKSVAVKLTRPEQAYDE
jgi:hypothetical protein